MKITAVIMAGGRGERFWPRSRNSFPKQFLSLTSDGETMIQKTVGRLESLVSLEDTFIVTNANYADLVREQLPEIPEENILLEPAARNTAPCIGLAASVIRKRYGDAVMLVLPSDHLIKFNQMFIDTLRSAIGAAEEGCNLVTIGITPTYPETGYGYIQFSADETAYPGIYGVQRFVEKPNIELAKEYCNSGEYLWNSGMFVWKASSIDKKLRKHLPDMAEGLDRIYDSVQTDAFESTVSSVFPKFRSESIDFGVMEKASDVFTIPGNFGWDDVGSWLALERINKTNEFGNMVQGDVISVNTKNTIVCGNKKLIATVGIEDLIVVDTDDALLICSKDSTQDVKKVIENLKICNRNEFV
ncbi:MAG: mannose-1-phosphate guanylyltransferase [Huintestinicola sp.]|uniref:mannose-1-phosphate guanylyltransferase n=1 Tax=Huintestinicola sp. TaxID=2981661 RepID=UPI003F027F85